MGAAVWEMLTVAGLNVAVSQAKEPSTSPPLRVSSETAHSLASGMLPIVALAPPATSAEKAPLVPQSSLMVHS